MRWRGSEGAAVKRPLCLIILVLQGLVISLFVSSLGGTYKDLPALYEHILGDKPLPQITHLLLSVTSLAENSKFGWSFVSLMAGGLYVFGGFLALYSHPENSIGVSRCSFYQQFGAFVFSGIVVMAGLAACLPFYSITLGLRMGPPPKTTPEEWAWRMGFMGFWIMLFVLGWFWIRRYWRLSREQQR